MFAGKIARLLVDGIKARARQLVKIKARPIPTIRSSDRSDFDKVAKKRLS
jgi:hypothetical protein